MADDTDSQRAPEGSRAGSGAGDGDGREETPKERLDRNFEELTGELRVVITGVQVLFGFLLVVPFDTGFEHVGGYERTVYFVALLLASLSAACLIAPSRSSWGPFRSRPSGSPRRCCEGAGWTEITCENRPRAEVAPCSSPNVPRF